MRTAIFERTKTPAGLPIEDDGLAANGAGKRRVFDLVVSGGGIPEVTQEHCHLPFERVS